MPAFAGMTEFRTFYEFVMKNSGRELALTPSAAFHPFFGVNPVL